MLLARLLYQDTFFTDVQSASESAKIHGVFETSYFQPVEVQGKKLEIQFHNYG